MSARRRRRWLRDALARVLSWLIPRRLLRDRRYFELWERRGLHVTRAHFYSPIPDTAELPDALFERRTEAVGVDWNAPAQVELLTEFAKRYRAEYDAFPREPLDEPRRFTLANDTFTTPDAEALYCMLRHFQPQRVVEIGSGRSTQVCVDALRANAGGADPAELTVIDPYSRETLLGELPGFARLVDRRVQDVPLDRFAVLGPGDVLFIDSSHVLKTGSDVQYEFLEILPRLRPGVLVHVHDIFLPGEYPRHWVRERRQFFNEQYLLQAFLSFNRSFEILWAGSYLHATRPDALREAFRDPPSGPLSGGGSFWMRRVA